MNKAIFAAGCFWGVEENFSNLRGVLSTKVGYIGGSKEKPTYEEVCRGDTNHAEAVLVEFDNKIITYEDLVRFFFSIHDPTTKDRQGLDVGTQYRSEIFYLNPEQKKIAERVKNELLERKPVITNISMAEDFHDAEDYHQQYIKKRKELV